MTPQQFAALAAEGYNCIPLSRELLADTETPLSAYLKLARGPCSYLLESVHGGEKWGRYSIIGLPCKTVLRVSGGTVEVRVADTVVERHRLSDPLAFIEQFQARYRIPTMEALPVFHGGLVGYFAYDAVRYVEPRLRATGPADELNIPDVLLLVSTEVVVFDNLAGTLRFIVSADPAQADALARAEARLDELIGRLQAPTPPLASIDLTATGRAPVGKDSTAENDLAAQARYCAGVARIKEYILAGDVMQTVLSQRLSLPFSAAPLDLYRALRNLNPSPYLYYLDLADFHIVGSSPEILARLERGEVTVRPIAGTRPRGHTEEEDQALQAELLADPKELAEHLMLIDLGRNDVGRIAVTGSVVLTERMVVEKYSHVMHIVSNVTGQLRPGKTAMDVLRAVLPAGTLSGAPKIRALEIIDELEPVRRGVYGGAVGYLSWQGDMDTAIAIRTAVVKDRVLYIQAGAGIVADSVPLREYEEAMNKAGAMLRAVAMVQAGSAAQG